MDASCQKLLPPPPLGIDTHQPVDRLNEPPDTSWSVTVEGSSLPTNLNRFNPW